MKGLLTLSFLHNIGLLKQPRHIEVKLRKWQLTMKLLLNILQDYFLEYPLKSKMTNMK